MHKVEVHCRVDKVRSLVRRGNLESLEGTSTGGVQTRRSLCRENEGGGHGLVVLCVVCVWRCQQQSTHEPHEPTCSPSRPGPGPGPWDRAGPWARAHGPWAHGPCPMGPGPFIWNGFGTFGTDLERIWNGFGTFGTHLERIWNESGTFGTDLEHFRPRFTTFEGPDSCILNRGAVKVG